MEYMLNVKWNKADTIANIKDRQYKLYRRIEMLEPENAIIKNIWKCVIAMTLQIAIVFK